jgi:chemotaxis protein CheC
MTHSVCNENTAKALDGDSTNLELLQQLFGAATYDASAAMCCWTNRLITLTLDEVYESPLAEACLGLNFDDERLTMVVLNLEGELGGAMVLTFNEEDGRRMAASLLDCEPGEGDEWNEMERSALAETGNILGCAYMNAITRLIDHELIPSVPYFVQDYGASVLEQAMVAQASGRDTVLICRTGFHCADENLNWRVLFIPTVGLRTAMEHALPIYHHSKSQEPRNH